MTRHHIYFGLAVACLIGLAIMQSVNPQPAEEGDSTHGHVARAHLQLVTGAKPRAPGDYTVIRVGGELIAKNAAQGLLASFSKRGVRIADSREDSYEMLLSAVELGCPGDMRALSAPAPTASGDQVEYRHPHQGSSMTEWYINSPLGLEQGFTITKPPLCLRGNVGLVVGLQIVGDLSATVHRSGDSVLLRDRFGRARLAISGFYARDARGHELRTAFAMDEGRLALHVEDRDAIYPVVIDPLITNQTAKLAANPGGPDESFGTAVSLSGHTALVGASGAARAYVFRRDHQRVFREEAVLTPGIPAPGFGSAVSVWGDIAVIGAPGLTGNDAGAVHVFVRTEDRDQLEWNADAVLTPDDGRPGDGFGTSAVISGHTLIVGAPWADGVHPSSGAAYIFTYSDGQWHQQAKLSRADVLSNAEFGGSVALYGNTAAVGARRADGAVPAAGSVYLFERSLGTWTAGEAIWAGDGQSDDDFGASVGLSADILLVGAAGHGNAGAAYLYERHTGVWSPGDKLLPGDAATREFGASVALRGEVAAVGSGRRGQNGQPRNAHLFERGGNRWSFARKIPGGGGVDDAFASSIALSGNAMLIGAPADGQNGARSGAAYAYSLSATGGAATELSCADSDTLGSLITCIRGQMPGSGSEGFVVPGPIEQADWRTVVAQMMGGLCAASVQVPASLAGPMRVSAFTDAESNKTYCVFMEVEDGDGDGLVDRGWGTFIVDPAATRQLGQQAPHPRYEANTATQAVDIFKWTDSQTFLMCGTHRHANSALSACDDRYQQSDCAHVIANMFHATVLELEDFYQGTDHAHVQWHGMGSTTCGELDAYISPGLATTPPPGAIVLDLENNVELYNSSWLVDVPGTGTCILNATHNPQGRYVNGVPESSICTTEATSNSNGFVHIEQKLASRVASAWIPAVEDTWPLGPTVPDAPGNLVATAGNAEVSLDWLAATGAVTYNVWRSTTSGSGYVLVAADITTTGHTDTGLGNGTTYYYVVTAVNEVGESGYSNEAAATPMDAPAPPAPRERPRSSPATRSGG